MLNHFGSIFPYSLTNLNIDELQKTLKKIREQVNEQVNDTSCNKIFSNFEYNFIDKEIGGETYNQLIVAIPGASKNNVNIALDQASVKLLVKLNDKTVIDWYKEEEFTIEVPFKDISSYNFIKDKSVVANGLVMLSFKKKENDSRFFKLD